VNFGIGGGVVNMPRVNMPKPDKCICATPTKTLRSGTYIKQDLLELILLPFNGKREGTWLFVFMNHKSVGYFEINYCPICGRSLKNAV
jgi:hypothetical protein